MDNENKVIELIDLRKVAYLVALKHRFINPPTQKNKLVVFSFIKTAKLEADLKDWDEGKTNVPLKKYAQSLAHIRGFVGHWSAVEMEVDKDE